jgi:hypothetical protein
VLISNSPPAVNADTHDHGARRPNRNDATLVHLPIASMASAPSDSCPAGGSNVASSARAHRKKCEAIGSARARNRCRQSRTVSPGTPSRSPARRYPSRPADNSAAPITSTTYRRRARQTSGSSTCVARHDRSRQRPRRGRNRRSPKLVRTSRNREQPQPPNTPARQRGHTNRPAARSASTTARSSETISTTTSNGVTGSLANGRVKVSAREPSNQQDHHHPVAGRLADASPSPRSVSQTAPDVTTQRVAQHMARLRQARLHPT